MSNWENSHRGPVAYARRGDRATSHQAAASISPKSLSSIQQVVGIILSRFGPMTDEELITKYRELESQPGKSLPGATDSSIRTRRKELVDAFMVFECGKKRNDNGRSSTLWSTKRQGAGR